MTHVAPGRVLGSVTPDVLPSRQHHCNVDKWRSLDEMCLLFVSDRSLTSVGAEYLENRQR